jgi:hypothetical protein
MDEVSSSRSGENRLTLRKNDESKAMLEVEDQISDDSLTRGSNDHQMHLFGNDLSNYSPDAQFGLCCCGIFTFSVLYAYLQELLAIHIAGRKFGLFLAVCQFAGYAFWSSILARINRYNIKTSRQTPVRVPTGKFIGLSLLRAFDLAVTNSAMMYLNYPAKTLIKSCRVVFTMFLGVLIRKKKYKLRDYAAVFTLVIGLLIFLHADSSSGAVFHPFGVLLLVSNKRARVLLSPCVESAFQVQALTPMLSLRSFPSSAMARSITGRNK